MWWVKWWNEIGWRDAMTVKELIKILSVFNPDAKVVQAESDPSDYSRLITVLPVENAKYKRSYVIKDDGSAIMLDPDLDTVAAKG